MISFAFDLAKAFAAPAALPGVFICLLT
jgi:hypothetical protein